MEIKRDGRGGFGRVQRPDAEFLRPTDAGQERREVLRRAGFGWE